MRPPCRRWCWPKGGTSCEFPSQRMMPARRCSTFGESLQSRWGTPRRMQERAWAENMKPRLRSWPQVLSPSCIARLPDRCGFSNQIESQMQQIVGAQALSNTQLHRRSCAQARDNLRPPEAAYEYFAAGEEDASSSTYSPRTDEPGSAGAKRHLNFPQRAAVQSSRRPADWLLHCSAGVSHMERSFNFTLEKF